MSNMLKVGLLVASFSISVGGAFAVQSVWTIDSASSCAVSISANQATISGPQNLHALASQAAPDSPAFRFSASIRAPETAEYAPALFLYWSANNWVRIGHFKSYGYYHARGPGIYAVVCENGNKNLHRLTNTSSRDFRYNSDQATLDPVPVADQWQDVALALDETNVYFQKGVNNSGWITLRTINRSGEFKRKPALVLLGRGYYEADRFPAPKLANDLADAGPIVSAEFKAITLKAVEPADLRLQDAGETAMEDDPGVQELAKPEDPTFESVASHWPELQYTRDALGVADHPQEFTVLPDGVILAIPNEQLLPGGKHQRVWFAVGDDRQRYGGQTTVSRQLKEGWLPVLTCGWQRESLHYEQTLAAWSKGMSPDTSMTGLLRMRVRNSSETTITARLALFSEAEAKEILVAEDQQIPALREISIYCEMPFPANGEELSASRIDAETFDSRIAEVAEAWRTRLSGGMEIQVPEERLMNAWRAWQCWQLIDVDKVNNAYEYHDGGGGFYELVYGYSASRAAQQADQLNRSDDARKWIEAMLNMASDDGKVIINYGLPDHGSLLNAVVHHYDYTGDKEWLRAVSPTLLKMCAWIRNARKNAKTGVPTTSPVHGMIKAQPYCDSPENAYFLPSDILLATGLRNTARVLKDIGYYTDAQWIDAEATAYISDLRRIVEKSIFQVDGQDLLPLFPQTRELLEAVNFSASNYYALLAPLLLEEGGEVIPPQSRAAKLIKDALEKRKGLLMGVPRFWDGIDHAYGGGYWSHCLSNGEPKKALLALYASMAYGMSRDTFSSVEVTFSREGKNFPTLPHNFSNLEQLRLVRNLLVMEQGDTLALGSGIARHWLASGQHVAVKNAATRWGNVTYRIDTAPVSDKITARLELPSLLPPGGAKLVIRHPAKKNIKQVRVTGATLVSQGSDFVILKDPCAEVTVEALY